MSSSPASTSLQQQEYRHDRQEGITIRIKGRRRGRNMRGNGSGKCTRVKECRDRGRNQRGGEIR